MDYVDPEMALVHEYIKQQQEAREERLATGDKRGHFTKVSSERVEVLMGSLRRGNYRNAAAKAAGISDRTLREWMDRIPHLKEAVENAEAQGEVNLVGMIEVAAKEPKNWGAAAWLLERKYPDRWGRRERLTAESVRQQAQRLATELGLNAEELIAEAERITRGGE